MCRKKFLKEQEFDLGIFIWLGKNSGICTPGAHRMPAALLSKCSVGL